MDILGASSAKKFYPSIFFKCSTTFVPTFVIMLDTADLNKRIVQ